MCMHCQLKCGMLRDPRMPPTCRPTPSAFALEASPTPWALTLHLYARHALAAVAAAAVEVPSPYKQRQVMQANGIDLLPCGQVGNLNR